MKRKTITLGIYLSLLIINYTFAECRNSFWNEEKPKESILKQKIQFYSDYQLDKTYSGSRIESRKKVNITIIDPKQLTKQNMSFDDLPKGYITIKYDGLKTITNEIVYIGKNRSNNDIYTITNTQLDYDILYIIRESHKVKSKNYSYIILMGKSDGNNLGGLPKFFTAYHSNTLKNK
ncbi:hypothetical protein [Elizabethkingia anophelis]|uniref:hypothetical protein n=1 Tax=Elizabethkingia anophelis TaxID=1117645 RepID=UPI000C6D473F|nr:hypothetical protein [Elizabethkingia anophelis]PKR31783.1 hypothetical protein CWH99_13710 [Elizabethkingia anophelis]PKR35573.1 hypothetical protein CWI00_00065 [Elizabethkingia anophelis]